MAEAALDRGQDLDGLGHHLRSDAVAREQHDPRHQSQPSRMPRAISDPGRRPTPRARGHETPASHRSGGANLGIHSGRRDSYAAILSAWRKVSPMSSSPSSSRCCVNSSSGNSCSSPTAGAEIHRSATSMSDFKLGISLHGAQQRLAKLGRDDHRHQSRLRRVVAEDVTEPRRDHGLKAIVRERPDGMLAR